jgi:3-hydroxyacyl-[acyl-carrier-protein] dehydratase
VAAELFIDLSTVDLAGEVVSHETVGRFNPQCGPMRQLDRVIWLSEDSLLGLGVKKVQQDEFWVPYHIPGRPLMPGVLMIEAAAQLCSVMRAVRFNDGKFLGFARCDNVAFRGQVLPGDTLYLLGRELSFKQRRHVSAAQGVVDGRLVFEATITGLVM